MNIRILQLLEGAREASGVAVIIDVFRAFSLEAFLMDRGARVIYPVADIARAYAMKRADLGTVLVGERHGKKCEGFDFGNSPSEVETADFTGKTVVHTTSAGTQGVAAAKSADLILLGSLVTARATADYIRSLDPPEVSLVCMGWEAKEKTADPEPSSGRALSPFRGDRVFENHQRRQVLRQGAERRLPGAGLLPLRRPGPVRFRPAGRPDPGRRLRRVARAGKSVRKRESFPGKKDCKTAADMIYCPA